MYFTEKQLGDLMVPVEESAHGVAQVTMERMNENEDLIESWIPFGSSAVSIVNLWLKNWH